MKAGVVTEILVRNKRIPPNQTSSVVVFPEYAFVMFPRSLHLRSLIAWILAASIAAPSQSSGTYGGAEKNDSTLVVAGLGKGTASLGGPWQFHLGDSASCASPSSDDSSWEQVRTEDPWGAQEHPAETGYAWYRRHLHIDPAPGASPAVSPLLQRVDDAYEAYFNGVLIGTNGKLPPHAVFYYPQPAQTFGLRPVRDGVLAFRVWKAPLESFDSDQMGGLYDPPIIGSPQGISSLKAELDLRWLRGKQYRFWLASLYALVMVLSFLIWLRSRSQPVPLWVSVFTFSHAAAAFLPDMRLPIPYSVGLGMLQPVLGAGDISLWFLLLYLLMLDERPRLAQLTRILTTIQIIAICLDGIISGRNLAGLDAALTAIFTALEMFPLVLVGFALHKRLDAARWPLRHSLQACLRQCKLHLFKGRDSRTGRSTSTSATHFSHSSATVSRLNC